MMTKLEEKLIQLGYEKHPKEVCVWFKKVVIEYTSVILNIVTTSDKIVNSFLTPPNEYVYLETQQDIDNLQQAFNQLQLDLEVLKEYE